MLLSIAATGGLCGTAQAETVGWWRFEPGAFLADSGGHPDGPFDLTNLGANNGNDAYALPVSGMGSAFPRVIPQTGAANSGAALFTSGETPADAFTIPYHAAFNSLAFTIEAIVHIPAGGVSVPLLAADDASDDTVYGMSVSSTNGVLLSVKGLAPGPSVLKTSVSSNLVAPAAGKDYYLAVSFQGSTTGYGQVTFRQKNLTDNTALLSGPPRVAPVLLLVPPSKPLRLGGYSFAYDWGGVVDEVRFSNSVLTVSGLMISDLATNADLASLTPGSGSLGSAFAPGTTAYSMQVAADTPSITFTPAVAQAGATVTVNGVATPSGSPSAAVPLAPGSNVITVVVTALNGTSTRTYTVTVIRPLDLTASLDGAGLSWTVGGTAGWYGQNATTHDNTDAAQSADVNDDQESWMETTVTGPGTLTYWWKVSSENNYDFLRFYIDGTEQTGRISGTVDWTQKSVAIAAGSHVLRWRYTKDGSDTAGADAGWVDEVSFTAGSNTYSTWRSSAFTAAELADPLVSGPSADPDRDGHVNVVECALGTLPKQSDSKSAFLPGTVNSSGQNYLTISFSRAQQLPSDMTLTVQTSPSMTNGTWTAVATKTGAGAWSSPALVTEGAAAAGRLPVTVRGPALTSGQRAYLRLTVGVP